MYEFEVVQDGIVVARASAKEREDALREIYHYAQVYGQDGPVRVREIIWEDDNGA